MVAAELLLPKVHVAKYAHEAEQLRIGIARIVRHVSDGSRSNGCIPRCRAPHAVSRTGVLRMPSMPWLCRRGRRAHRAVCRWHRYILIRSSAANKESASSSLRLSSTIGNFLVPVPGIDRLIGCERDHDADEDRSHLLDEVFPAADRLVVGGIDVMSHARHAARGRASKSTVVTLVGSRRAAALSVVVSGLCLA